MCIRNLSMCRVGARIFMNVLLVSGPSMCLSLRLKCLYLLLSSFSCCFPLAPHMEGPASSSVLHGFHMSVCAFDGLSWRVRSRRGAGPSFASHVSIPMGICPVNEPGGLASKEAAFFLHPSSASSSGERELEGSWGRSLGEDDGTSWRVYMVTLRRDLRRTSGWKSEAVWVHQSVSLNLALCSVPPSYVLENKQFICDLICSAFSHDNSKVKPILSLRNRPWKLAPESLLPFSFLSMEILVKPPSPPHETLLWNSSESNVCIC